MTRTTMTTFCVSPPPPLSSRPPPPHRTLITLRGELYCSNILVRGVLVVWGREGEEEWNSRKDDITKPWPPRPPTFYFLYISQRNRTMQSINGWPTLKSYSSSPSLPAIVAVTLAPNERHKRGDCPNWHVSIFAGWGRRGGTHTHTPTYVVVVVVLTVVSL